MAREGGVELPVLPVELWLMAMEHLKDEALVLTCSLVSREFNVIARANSIWQAFYHTRFHVSELFPFSMHNRTWKQMYVQRRTIESKNLPSDFILTYASATPSTRYHLYAQRFYTLSKSVTAGKKLDHKYELLMASAENFQSEWAVLKMENIPLNKQRINSANDFAIVLKDIGLLCGHDIALATSIMRVANEHYYIALQHPQSAALLIRNWAVSLVEQHSLLGDDFAPDLDKQFAHIDSYCIDLLAKRPSAEILWSWGCAIRNQARTKKDVPSAKELFKLSIEKFELSIVLDPKSHTIERLGDTLGYWALIESEAESDILYEKAYVQFRRCLEIERNALYVICTWSITLLEQGLRKQPDQRMLLLEEARKLLNDGLSTNPTATPKEKERVYFCLARVSAQMNDVDQCREWLEKLTTWDYLGTATARQLLHLANVTHYDWFQQLRTHQ